jgi:excisionase family DNA binding protein
MLIMTDQEPRFYSTEEVAEILRKAGLNFTERTIRNWIKAGRIKAIRPGLRQWFVSAEEVKKLLGESGVDDTQGNSRPMLLAA